MTETHVLAPVEPTEAMCEAGWQKMPDSIADAYRAMLAAAPPPPEDAVGHDCPSCDKTAQFEHGVPINPNPTTRVIPSPSPREKALEEALGEAAGVFEAAAHTLKEGDAARLIFEQAAKDARAKLEGE